MENNNNFNLNQNITGQLNQTTNIANNTSNSTSIQYSVTELFGLMDQIAFEIYRTMNKEACEIYNNLRSMLRMLRITKKRMRELKPEISDILYEKMLETKKKNYSATTKFLFLLEKKVEKNFENIFKIIKNQKLEFKKYEEKMLNALIMSTDIKNIENPSLKQLEESMVHTLNLVEEYEENIKTMTDPKNLEFCGQHSFEEELKTQTKNDEEEEKKQEEDEKEHEEEEEEYEFEEDEEEEEEDEEEEEEKNKKENIKKNIYKKRRDKRNKIRKRFRKHIVTKHKK